MRDLKASQAVQLVQCQLCDSSGVALQNQTRSLYIGRTVNKQTWGNPRYNTELFYFSVGAFETPNKRASIYDEQVCEGVYISEYLQHNENW